MTEEEKKEVTLHVYNTQSVVTKVEDHTEYVNEFKIINELGSGGFSTVYLAHRQYTKNGEIKEFPLALKAMLIRTLKKTTFIAYNMKGEQGEVSALEKAYHEINIMGQVEHENIVKIYEMIEAQDHDYLYIALELCHFGQIADYNIHNDEYVRNNGLVKYLTETLFGDVTFDTENDKVEHIAKYIFKRALHGLEYLHHKYIAHRDIKPDNIFFSKDGNNAKLGDFTVSVKMFGPDDKQLSSKAGTPFFMAPEIDPPEVEGT